MTYGELKTLFAYKYEQTGAPATGAEVRNKFINLAVKNIFDRRNWRWTLTDGTATTDGTEELDLTGGISSVKTLKVDGEKYTQINEDEEDYYSTDSTVFYVKGNVSDGFTVVFPCAIPEAGLSVTYRYRLDHSAYTSDSDTCPIPKPEAVADLAVGLYFQSEGEHDEAMPFLENAENGINEMISQEKRTGGRKRFISTDLYYGKDFYDIEQMY